MSRRRFLTEMLRALAALVLALASIALSLASLAVAISAALNDSLAVWHFVLLAFASLVGHFMPAFGDRLLRDRPSKPPKIVNRKATWQGY
jgi:hypothetical protein